MSGDKDVFLITVKLVNGDFKLPVKRADEAYFRDSAKLVGLVYDKFTKEVSSSYNSFGIDSYLKLTALDLGVRLLKQLEINKQLNSRLEALEKEIDQALE